MNIDTDNAGSRNVAHPMDAKQLACYRIMEHDPDFARWGGSIMRVPASHYIAFPLALSLLACANPRASYEARMRATEQRMMSRAQESPDKLTAEVEAKIADYERRLETWKPQLREYSLCNERASQVVATQPGDPISLAMAARNLCRSQEQDLRKAIYAAYADNPGFGIEAMEKVRKSVLENNTGEIVAYRAKANSTPAPSRPAEPPPNRSI